jgi:hypothetical protein
LRGKKILGAKRDCFRVVCTTAPSGGVGPQDIYSTYTVPIPLEEEERLLFIVCSPSLPEWLALHDS